MEIPEIHRGIAELVFLGKDSAYCFSNLINGQSINAYANASVKESVNSLTLGIYHWEILGQRLDVDKAEGLMDTGHGEKGA